MQRNHLWRYVGIEPGPSAWCLVHRMVLNIRSISTALYLCVPKRKFCFFDKGLAMESAGPNNPMIRELPFDPGYICVLVELIKLIGPNDPKQRCSRDVYSATSSKEGPSEPRRRGQLWLLGSLLCTICFSSPNASISAALQGSDSSSSATMPPAGSTTATAVPTKVTTTHVL